MPKKSGFSDTSARLKIEVTRIVYALLCGFFLSFTLDYFIMGLGFSLPVFAMTAFLAWSFNKPESNVVRRDIQHIRTTIQTPYIGAQQFGPGPLHIRRNHVQDVPCNQNGLTQG